MKRRFAEFARFRFKYKNRPRLYPGPDDPLRFLCGSEEDLRRVTMWACHIHPELFQSGSGGVVEVRYRSRLGDKPGFGSFVWASWARPLDELPKIMEDAQDAENLLALALIHNEFVFTFWASTHEQFGIRWWETAGDIIIKVHSPSAHERAESLLALSEWLDGKVSEEEKRELLQLPDEFEF